MEEQRGGRKEIREIRKTLFCVLSSQDGCHPMHAVVPRLQQHMWQSCTSSRCRRCWRLWHPSHPFSPQLSNIISVRVPTTIKQYVCPNYKSGRRQEQQHQSNNTPRHSSSSSLSHPSRLLQQLIKWIINNMELSFNDKKIDAMVGVLLPSLDGWLTTTR